MVRRLILGLVLGLIVGGVVAAALVRLGAPAFAGPGGIALAYLSAAVVGAITGIIAGKPIWAGNAKIEGGLKAVFGALMGAGAMFALRTWLTSFAPDLSFIGAGGPAPVGELPAASLPLIAAVLGGLFGLDNTAEKEEAAAPGRKRIGAGSTGKAAKARVAEAEEGEDAEAAPRRGRANGG
jgi:hypothetical protein